MVPVNRMNLTNNPIDKTFSDTNNTSNFQTENMKHKIKTVHKKKKSRNYKNIEPLENIHDNMDNDAEDNDKEGFAPVPIATFSEDDWTQPDNIYEGKRRTAPTKTFSGADMVNSVYDSVDNLVTSITAFIVTLLSGKDYNKSDIPIVKKYVCWGASIVVATIAAFNWAFMMFYKEMGSRIDLYDISRNWLHEAGIVNKIYALLDFLLDIPIFFPEKLQEYAVKTGPEVLTDHVNVTVCFTALFFILTKFFYTSASSVRTVLVDLASFNMSNPILSVMYGTTFLLYVLSFFEFKPISTALQITKLIAGFPTSLIVPFLSNMFKILFLLMLAVPIAATMCFVYIIAFSFFGIPLLSDHSFLDTITKIREFFNENRLPIKKDTVCNPLSFVDKIINNVYMAFDFVYKYVVQISLLIMLIFGLVDYSKNIKGSLLQLLLIIIHVILVVVVGTSIFKDYFIKPLLDEDKPVTAKAPQAPEPEPLNFSESVMSDFNSATSMLNINPDKIADLKQYANKLPDVSNLTSKIPDVSELKQYASKIPDVSELKQYASNIPDVSNLASKIPDVSNLASNIPDVSNIASKIPDVSNLTSKVADVSNLASKIPDVSNLTSKVADVSNLASKIPDASKLASKVPDASKLASKIPDASKLASKIPDMNEFTSKLSRLGK